MFLCAGAEQAGGAAGVQPLDAAAAPRVDAGLGVQAAGVRTPHARRADDDAAPDGSGQSEGVHDAPRARDEAQALLRGEAAAQESAGEFLSLSLSVCLSLSLSVKQQPKSLRVSLSVSVCVCVCEAVVFGPVHTGYGSRFTHIRTQIL